MDRPIIFVCCALFVRSSPYGRGGRRYMYVWISEWRVPPYLDIYCYNIYHISSTFQKYCFRIISLLSYWLFFLLDSRLRFYQVVPNTTTLQQSSVYFMIGSADDSEVYLKRQTVNDTHTLSAVRVSYQKSNCILKVNIWWDVNLHTEWRLQRIICNGNALFILN